MKEPKVLVRIVDDDASIRDSLSYMLEKAGFACRAYGSANAFLTQDAPSIPGCVVLDVRMPGMSGLALQNEMNRRAIRLPIVFFSGHGDLDMAVDAMRRGATTFLQKTVSSEKLLSAVAEAVETSLSQEPGRLTDSELVSRWQTLSPHEQEIALLMGDGLLTTDIARRLGVSAKTVYNYRVEVNRKLRTKTPADIARLVLRIRRIADPSGGQCP